MWKMFLGMMGVFWAWNDKRQSRPTHKGKVPVLPNMRRHKRVGVPLLPPDKGGQQQHAEHEHGDDVCGPAISRTQSSFEPERQSSWHVLQHRTSRIAHDKYTKAGTVLDRDRNDGQE
jgi:hypothetical protein